MKKHTKNLASNFFQKAIDSLKKTFEKHKFLTVFELYVFEIFNEVVQNLKHESPPDLLMKPMPITHTQMLLVEQKKGLLPIEFGRTKIKSTSIQNILQKGYNLMREFNFTSENVNDLSIQQAKQWSEKIYSTL